MKTTVAFTGVPKVSSVSPQPEEKPLDLSSSHFLNMLSSSWAFAGVTKAEIAQIYFCLAEEPLNDVVPAAVLLNDATDSY